MYFKDLKHDGCSLSAENTSKITGLAAEAAMHVVMIVLPRIDCMDRERRMAKQIFNMEINVPLNLLCLLNISTQNNEPSSCADKGFIEYVI